MIVGIDASNIRAGGGVTHLVELLRAVDPQAHGFSQVIIWSGSATLNRIDDRPWLVKCHQTILDKALPYRTFWQCFKLSTLTRLAGCDVLFVPGGSYAGNFHPMVTLSQNLLPFEWREIGRFGWSWMSFKLFILRITQVRTFHQADGLIFLTRYARDVVLKVIKTASGKTTIVSHGIDKRFVCPPREQLTINQYSTARPFRILYVSIIDMHKHQWHVAEAVASLRNAGLPLEIDFIGPAYGPALKLLSAAIQRHDPKGAFLHYRSAIPFEELHSAYRQADAFVFASSCENLPNILVEAMAGGLPIASSNKGPMPEVLGEAGLYFDPLRPGEIADALLELFNRPALRRQLADQAYVAAQKYSWARCAQETFSFIAQVADHKQTVIVIDAFSARRGGGQTYILNLLQHLDALGDVRVYVLAPESLKLPQDPRIERLKVGWPTRNPILRSLWEIFALPSVLEKLHADILFCPGGLINTRTPAGCRSVTMFRNMIPFMPQVRRLYPLGLSRIRNWLLERAMLRSMQQADLVIFIAEYAKGVIEAHSGRPLKRAVTIPHGISDHFRVDPLHEPHRPPGLPDGDYLLYVSIFEPYKHHLEVVRGFHLLKSLRPTPEKLVLAGKNDLLAGIAVRQEISRLGLQDEVILVGNIAYQELPAYYRHARINIFASACENCPNILLEALGAGRPLLVSDIPPMPEFGGEAVVYFDPSSPDNFAHQIMSIIDCPDKLDMLGWKALKQAEKYNWTETARRTWDAISKLASEK